MQTINRCLILFSFVISALKVEGKVERLLSSLRTANSEETQNHFQRSAFLMDGDILKRLVLYLFTYEAIIAAVSHAVRITENATMGLAAGG